MIDPDFKTATWNPPCVFSNMTIGRCGLSKLCFSRKKTKKLKITVLTNSLDRHILHLKVKLRYT